MSQRSIGIDLRGDTLRIATTRVESGRIIVDNLEQVPLPYPDEQAWADGACVTLSVPESQVMVKAVRIGPRGTVPLSDRLRFELVQSLLESETLFHMDTVATASPDRYLGTIFRREHLKELTERVGLAALAESPRLSVQLRSVALGRGYLAFCSAQDGGLVVLVDLAADAASICFVYERQIADVASLAMSNYDLTDESGRRRFGVDLKTIMNYKQSTLREAGISVPPSALYLSGEPFGTAVSSAIQFYFSIEVVSPPMIDAYFVGLDQVARDALPDYLVALGLTVN